MDEKLHVYREVLNNPKNRLITGLIVVGLGIGVACLGAGLIASAYIRTKH